MALLVAERAPPAGQRGEVGFHLRDMREGVIPAPFSFSCYQAVVRIDPILLPSGPLDLVTRLLQLEGGEQARVGRCRRLVGIGR